MNKAKIFKLSTILLLASFLTQVITVVCMVFLRGLMIHLKLFRVMAEVHEYNGFVFATLVLAHLFFNWGWVRANLLKKIFPVVLLAGFICSAAYCAPENGDIQLPAPDMKGGKPLMEALKDRKSERSFSTAPLAPQVLSDLLWAASGINRPESGLRTAPTAMNCQEIDIYAAMQSGLYLYEPKRNTLVMVSDQDIRKETGKQAFVGEAPVNLIFVLDLNKAARFGEKMMFYAATDTGYISENVYLFCASEGLATVVRGMFDGEALSKAMKLAQGKKIILTQTVGYRK